MGMVMHFFYDKFLIVILLTAYHTTGFLSFAVSCNFAFLLSIVSAYTCFLVRGFASTKVAKKSTCTIQTTWPFFSSSTSSA